MEEERACPRCEGKMRINEMPCPTCEGEGTMIGTKEELDDLEREINAN